MKHAFTILLMALLLLSGTAYAATSKQYLVMEAPITIGDSGTIVLTMNNLAFGAGRMSTRYNRGTAARAALFEWRCTITLTGTNTVGQVIEWYLATSDGTTIDGNLSATDGALPTDKRNNLKPIGITIVDQATTNTPIIASGWVLIPSQYFSWGVWNGTTATNFQATAGGSSCTLTPFSWENQ
jgi:hypothetical protein